MFAMCLKWKDQKRRSRKTSHLVPFSSSKVIRLSVILVLVTSEISLYRICCFSDLDLHLDANVTADNTSLSNFNFSPAIIKSNRLFILIFPLSQAPIRRASYSPITSFSSSLLMLLRKSNVSRTLPNSPKVKKRQGYKYQSIYVKIICLIRLHEPEPDAHRNLSGVVPMYFFFIIMIIFVIDLQIYHKMVTLFYSFFR